MFSILKKPQNTINADDLEQLQNEIERHLANNFKQRWKLERFLDSANDVASESASQPISALNNDSNSNKAAISSSQPASSLPGGKLRNSMKLCQSKTQMDDASDGFKGSLNHGAANSNETDSLSSESSLTSILKNGAPDKLWPFVEQFCVTPTEEQMETLEDMLKSMENDRDYYRLPTSLKKDSNSNHVNNNKSQRKSKAKAEDTSLGALTQRLVSSFFEEVEDDGDVSKSSSDASSPAAKKRRIRDSKGLDVDNAKNLEKRIRQQLEEYSILSQQDDIPFTSEEDEILRELLAHQHELLSIQTQNKLAMQTLLERAKRHSELGAERAKLMEASADVFAAYYRLIQGKKRKRNPTKRERDAAYRALRLHEAIFKKCDELYITSRMDYLNNA